MMCDVGLPQENIAILKSGERKTIHILYRRHFVTVKNDSRRHIQTGCHAEPGACYIILRNLALEVGCVDMIDYDCTI